MTVWLGYTFDPQYSHGTFTRREHRFRQQVNFDGFAKLGKVKLSGRLRMEERWREGQPGTGWRLRPQLKASMPVAGKLSLSVASEPFINLNNTVFQTTDGLDRVRNSIALSLPLGKKFTVEAGYLNQHGFVPNAADTSDHVFTLGSPPRSDRFWPDLTGGNDFPLARAHLLVGRASGGQTSQAGSGHSGAEAADGVDDVAIRRQSAARQSPSGSAAGSCRPAANSTDDQARGCAQTGSAAFRTTKPDQQQSSSQQGGPGGIGTPDAKMPTCASGW